MGIKVLVCGGRGYKDAATVEEVLNDIHHNHSVTILIQGEARGADYLGKLWAMGRGIETVDCPANWNLYGKSAGYKRNAYMLELNPDLVVAFPGGVGTQMMIDIAKKGSIKVVEVGKA